MPATLNRCPSQLTKADLWAEVQRCHKRLEIDRYWKLTGECVRIPYGQRNHYPDGISCRDETIRLQDDVKKRSELKKMWLRVEVSSCADGTMKIEPEWRGVRKYTPEDGGGPGLLSRLSAAQWCQSLINAHLGQGLPKAKDVKGILK